MNVEDCHISVGGNSLELVNEYKYLVVWLTKSLSRRKQIGYLVAKVYRIVRRLIFVEA